MPRPDTGTAGWWLLRPVWIVVAGAVLAVLVAVFGRFEVHPKPEPFGSAPRSSAGVAAVGVVLTGFAILGFGVTGFNRPIESLGEDLLGLELNPLVSLVHLGAGLLLLYALYRGSAGTRRVVLGFFAVLFLGLGLLGADGIDVLGTNAGTAMVHVGFGVVGLVLLVWSGLEERQ